jgi:hypothetical protein
MTESMSGFEARARQSEIREAAERRSSRPRFEPPAPVRRRLPTRLRGWRSV